MVDEDLKRAWLAHYGAPLFGQSLVAGRVAPALEKVVADGLALSRRDASVTRALPVLFWLRRADLDMVRLRRLATSIGRERTLGFFLDLTARLSATAASGTPRWPCGRSVRAPRRNSSPGGRARSRARSPRNERRPSPGPGVTE